MKQEMLGASGLWNFRKFVDLFAPLNSEMPMRILNHVLGVEYKSSKPKPARGDQGLQFAMTRMAYTQETADRRRLRVENVNGCRHGDFPFIVYYVSISQMSFMK
jgi:hypothetical protein